MALPATVRDLLARKVGVPVTARTSPVGVVQGGKTVSGAASVVIATYTVPASRRALIETLQGALILTVAMAAGDVGELQAEVQPFGGAAVVIGYDRLAGAQAIGAAVR